MKCAIILVRFQRFDEGTKRKASGERKLIAVSDGLYILVLLDLGCTDDV